MDLSGLSSVTNASQLTEWLAANMVTPVSPAISASDMGIIMQKIVAILNSGGSGGGGLVIYSVQTGNYTLALTDKAIDMSSSSANTLTILANSAIAFPVGTQILLTQSGTGQTTVAGQSGVTILSADGKVSLRSQYSWASLVKRDTDVWWLSGDLGDTVTPPPAAVVKINLTEGSPAPISGWNNFSYDFSTTPVSLLTAAGDASGMSIVRTPESPDNVNPGTISGSYGNADFPDEVIQTLWYILNGTGLASLTISGLTVNQLYTVEVFLAEPDVSTSNTVVLVGTAPNVTSHFFSPYPTGDGFVFNEVTSDDSGNLVIQFEGADSATRPVLNGIIISES